MHLAGGSGLALLEGAVQLALRWFLEPALPITRAYLTLLRTNFQSDLLIYFLIVLGWSAYDLRRRSRERELIAARLEDELHQATLAALRFQVEPPVLRQVLSRAADLIPTDPERADALLSRIAELLRSVVRTDPTQWISLEEELRLFHTFLAVDGALGDGLVSCQVEPSDSDARLPVPPFLLHLLVRAVNESEQRRAIRVEVSGSEEQRTVTVTAGAGSDEGGPSSSGLEAVEKRLAQFYGHPRPLHVQRLPSGEAQVELRLGRPSTDPGPEEQPISVTTAHR
jgi:LytS/YehU family sensor histidine kinase